MESRQNHPVRLFLMAEAVLYVLILLADWAGLLPAWLGNGFKYAALLGCLGMAAVWSREEKEYDVLQVWCFIFTVIADFFFLFTTDSDWLVMGFVSAVLVQILYMSRLWKVRYPDGKQTLDEKRTHVSLRGFLAAAIVVVMRIFSKMGPINLRLVAAVVMICFLLGNVIDAGLLLAKRRGGILLMFIGLVLFLFAAINLGLSHLGTVAPDAGGSLIRFAVPLMWTFYLPSQVILVLSGGERT